MCSGKQKCPGEERPHRTIAKGETTPAGDPGVSAVHTGKDLPTM